MSKTRECAERQRSVMVLIFTLGVLWAIEPGLQDVANFCKEALGIWPQ